MTSITNTSQILPSMQVESSAGHYPERITIAECDEGIIRIFKHFKGDISACKVSQNPHEQSGIIGLAAHSFIDSLDNLLENPATKRSANIACALFAPLFTKGLEFQSYTWKELDGFLTGVLNGSVYLERQSPTQSAESHESPRSTERTLSPEEERSSGTFSSPPVSTNTADTEIPEEISPAPVDAPPGVPEEDIDAYADDFEPESSLPARG